MRTIDTSLLAAGDLILIGKGYDSRLDTFYGRHNSPYSVYVFDRFADTARRVLILRDADGCESELSLSGDRYSLEGGVSGDVSDVKHLTAKEAADFGLQGRLMYMEYLAEKFASQDDGGRLEFRKVLDPVERAIIADWRKYFDLSNMDESRANLEGLVSGAEVELRQVAAVDLEILKRFKAVLVDYNRRISAVLRQRDVRPALMGEVSFSWKSKYRMEESVLPVGCGYVFSVGENRWDRVQKVLYAHRATGTRIYFSSLESGEEVGYIAASAQKGGLYYKELESGESLGVFDIDFIHAEGIEGMKRHLELMDECAQLMDARSEALEPLCEELKAHGVRWALDMEFRDIAARKWVNEETFGRVSLSDIREIECAVNQYEYSLGSFFGEVRLLMGFIFDK